MLEKICNLVNKKYYYKNKIIYNKNYNKKKLLTCQHST